MSSDRRTPFPPREALPRIDPCVCPLCGGPNACARELEGRSGVIQPPCWCVQATFGPDLLARVPAAARGLACVCARCAGWDASAPAGDGAA